MSKLEDLMPRTIETLVGLNNPAKHIIRQLSLKKQLEASEWIKKIVSEMIQLSRTKGKKNDDVFITRIFDLLGKDLPSFLHTLTGIDQEIIEDATTEQIIAIVESIYQLNFALLEKKIQGIVGWIQKRQIQMIETAPLVSSLQQ